MASLVKAWRALIRWVSALFTRKPKLRQGAYNNPISGAGPMHHGRIQP